MASKAFNLTPEENSRLDLLLNQWQRQHHLSPTVVEEIRQNVLATTETLPADWWLQFNKKMNRILTDSNQLQKQMAKTFKFSKQHLLTGRQLSSYRHSYLRPAGT